MAERQRVRQEKILLVERPGRSSKFQFQPKLGLGTLLRQEPARYNGYAGESRLTALSRYLGSRSRQITMELAASQPGL